MKALLLELIFVPLTAICLALAEDGRELKVGLLLPLSGPYAAIGEDNRRGVELAMAQGCDTKRIKFIYADSRAEPVQSVSEFKKMMESDHVDVVFAYRGPVGMAVNPLSLKAQIPLLGGVGNKAFAASNQYAFQIWPRSDREGEFVADQFTLAGAKRVALFTTDDDWTVAVTDGARSRLNAKDVKIVSDQQFGPNDLDFRSYLAKLSTNPPDLIFVNMGLKQIAPMIRQIRELRLPSMIFSSFWAAKPEVISAAGDEAMEGVRFAEMDGRLSGLTGDGSGATVAAYAGTALLKQVACQLPAKFDKDDVYRQLLSQKVVRTASGDYPITERCVDFPLITKEIRAGKVSIAAH